jgi:hypothetical protein
VAGVLGVPSWVCPRCSTCVSSAFDRNLYVLVLDHRLVECPNRDKPREAWAITKADEKFLEERKVSW